MGKPPKPDCEILPFSFARPGEFRLGECRDTFAYVRIRCFQVIYSLQAACLRIIWLPVHSPYIITCSPHWYIHGAPTTSLCRSTSTVTSLEWHPHIILIPRPCSLSRNYANRISVCRSHRQPTGEARRAPS